MRSQRSLFDDERAIEGLPIRLVIALVVGVASLSLMMGVLGGFSFGGEAEVDIKPANTIVDGPGGSGDMTVTVTVLTADGEPVEGARVIAGSGTLSLGSPVKDNGATGPDGQTDVTISHSNLNWRSNQEKGTLNFDIRVPGDSGFADKKSNTKITVLRN